MNGWPNLQCTVKVPVAVIDPTALSASQMYSPSSFRVTPSSFRLRSSKMCTRSVDGGKWSRCRRLLLKSSDEKGSVEKEEEEVALHLKCGKFSHLLNWE